MQGMKMKNGPANTDGDLLSASLRPFHQTGRWYWPLVAFLSLLVMAGVGAWVYQLIYGLGVTGLNDHVFWGIYLADLVTFIGLSYGGALVSAILRLTDAGWRAPITRMAEATALVTLIVGSIYVFVHMGRPERVWEFLTTPNGSSPLLWDAAAIATYLVATLIFLYLPLIPDLAMTANRVSGWRQRLYRFLSAGWEGLSSQRRVLSKAMTTMAIVIIPIAVMVHSVLSWAFSLTARDGWHSSIFGPYFVFAALYSGVALVILVVLAFRRGYDLGDYIGERQIRNLGYIMLALDVFYLYLTFTDLLTEGWFMAAPAAEYLEVLLLGDYGTLFWAFVIGGGVIPALLVAIPRTRNSTGIGIASGLVVVSMWLKRVLITVPPLTIPMVPTVPGELGTYSGSWVEFVATLGGVAAIPLGLMLFFRVFPVLSVDEIVEVREERRAGQEPMHASEPVQRGREVETHV